MLFNWLYACLGGCPENAAVILYFFFESGLLEGALWPDMNKIGYALVTVGDDPNSLPISELFIPNKQICLLIIWSVVAGFSENFVPDLMHKTSKKSGSPK